MIPFTGRDPADGPSTRPGNPTVRWLATVVVVLFVPIVVLVGIAGLFADGGAVLERILLGFINPIAALPTAWAMLDDEFFLARRAQIATVAAAALVGNLISSVTLFAGWSAGDGEIPLILAIPSAVYLLYHLLTD